jgi:hypothetical protein
MRADGPENLAEQPSVGDMRPEPLTGRRPTLERIRVEAAEAASRARRRITVTRIALGVMLLSLAAIAYALLAR